MKDYDKAITDCDEAIRLDPGFANAYGCRGLVWAGRSEFDKALADYTEAIRLNPRGGWVYENRGYAWENKKQFNKAIADYGEAIRLDPKGALAYNATAWIWATCPETKYRDGKKAVEAATHACELSQWRDAEHLGTLAAAYAEAGEFAKAIEFQVKAIKLYTSPADQKMGEARLELYIEKKPYRETSDRDLDPWRYRLFRFLIDFLAHALARSFEAM